MQMEDLIELAKRVQAQQAEAQTVEVKAAHRGCPSKLRDTLSSFSNQNSGGILLFGLDENEHFAAVGVYDLQDLQKKNNRAVQSNAAAGSCSVYHRRI